MEGETKRMGTVKGILEKRVARRKGKDHGGQVGTCRIRRLNIVRQHGVGTI